MEYKGSSPSTKLGREKGGDVNRRHPKVTIYAMECQRRPCNKEHWHRIEREHKPGAEQRLANKTKGTKPVKKKDCVKCTLKDCVNPRHYHFEGGKHFEEASSDIEDLYVKQEPESKIQIVQRGACDSDDESDNESLKRPAEAEVEEESEVISAGEDKVKNDVNSIMEAYSYVSPEQSEVNWRSAMQEAREDYLTGFWWTRKWFKMTDKHARMLADELDYCETHDYWVNRLLLARKWGEDNGWPPHQRLRGTRLGIRDGAMYAPQYDYMELEETRVTGLSDHDTNTPRSESDNENQESEGDDFSDKYDSPDGSDARTALSEEEEEDTLPELVPESDSEEDEERTPPPPGDSEEVEHKRGNSEEEEKENSSDGYALPWRLRIAPDIQHEYPCRSNHHEIDEFVDNPMYSRLNRKPAPSRQKELPPAKPAPQSRDLGVANAQQRLEEQAKAWRDQQLEGKRRREKKISQCERHARRKARAKRADEESKSPSESSGSSGSSSSLTVSSVSDSELGTWITVPKPRGYTDMRKSVTIFYNEGELRGPIPWAATFPQRIGQAVDKIVRVLFFRPGVYRVPTDDNNDLFRRVRELSYNKEYEVGWLAWIATFGQLGNVVRKRNVFADFMRAMYTHHEKADVFIELAEHLIATLVSSNTHTNAGEWYTHIFPRAWLEIRQRGGQYLRLNNLATTCNTVFYVLNQLTIKSGCEPSFVNVRLKNIKQGIRLGTQGTLSTLDFRLSASTPQRQPGFTSTA